MFRRRLGWVSGAALQPGLGEALDNMEFPMTALKRFLKNEDGATAIEYGLIAALIGVAIITAVGLVGTGLNTTFNTISTKLGAAG